MKYRSHFSFRSAISLGAVVLSFFSVAQARQTTDLDTKGWQLWLDRKAEWKKDQLVLPPADLSKLAVHPPTAGWPALFAKSAPESEADQILANPALSMDVQVPGVVEEYFWDALSGNKHGAERSGDYVGVSWWGRDFTVPADARGQRVKLFFSEGVRQRAEIFVNEKLVGYELVHQMPFEVDVTDAVKYGASNKLAVRITDHGGNFSWGDGAGMLWGEYFFPLSHGFGGILGKVQMRVVAPPHIADVFVKNKPTLTDVDADIEISNEGAANLQGSVTAEIVEAWQHNLPVAKPRTVFSKSTGALQIPAGKSLTVSVPASVPTAKLWGIRDSNLYNLVVTLKDAQGRVVDQYTQRFGFRFMSIFQSKTDTYYELNGKRVFILSGISWGFWPVTGIFPLTPELARKHVESALALGQNMLNFHRCAGNGLVLDAADELGILYYEEPGGYTGYRINPGNPNVAQAKDFTLASTLTSQRLARMVKRDRNHPSLVFYNLANEPGWAPDEQTKKDMAAAHLLDPTRTISYGSGFMEPEKDQPQKLHMIPYDQTQYTLGYTDVHNAGNSPGVYTDNFYSSPTNFRRDLKDPTEIYIWGEEGAIATPPQLEMLQEDFKKAGRMGWDGSDYKDWYETYVDYIREKGLQKYYPSLTGLITSLGDIMYYEHGRVLENVRIADSADINVLNGYEDMKLDNMSGAVDIFRNLKGHPELIRQYAQPLFVAVKAREKIGEVGGTNLFDLYVINEHALPAGDYVVKAQVRSPDGKIRASYDGKVHLSGGNKFSDFVTEKVPVILNAGKGYYNITAVLQDASGKVLANGHDEMFAVDWRSDVIKGKGAVLGGAAELLLFARNIKKADVAPYADNLGRLDYVVVGSVSQGKVFRTIPPSNFRARDGKTYGLNLDYFRGSGFKQQIDQRISTAPIDFDLKGKPIPGYDILGETDFSLRWQGFLVPSYSGVTQLKFPKNGGTHVWLDGKELTDSGKGTKETVIAEVSLQAGKSYALKIEASQAFSQRWDFAFQWLEPVQIPPVNLAKLLDRVRNDGTRLLVVEDGESWVKELQKAKAFPDFKVFHPSKTWVGSNYFVREHPFFKDLPVNGGMNWEYQRLVMYDGPSHFGLYDMKGEDAVVSLVGGVSHIVATAVGVMPYGKGSIAFSDLDLAPSLLSEIKAAAVPKKIFSNMLMWGGAGK